MSPTSIYRYRYALILVILVATAFLDLLANCAPLRPAENIQKIDQFFSELKNGGKKKGAEISSGNSTGGQNPGNPSQNQSENQGSPLVGGRKYRKELFKNATVIIKRPTLNEEEVRYYLTFFPLISLIIIVTIAFCSSHKRKISPHEPFAAMAYQFPQVAKNVINYSQQRQNETPYEGRAVNLIATPPLVRGEPVFVLGRRNKDSMRPPQYCSDDDSSSDMSDDDYPCTLMDAGYLADDDFGVRSQPFERLRNCASKDSFESSSEDELRFEKEIDDEKAIARMNPFHPLYAHAAVSPNRAVKDIMEELPQGNDNSERLIIHNAMESIAKAQYENTKTETVK